MLTDLHCQLRHHLRQPHGRLLLALLAMLWLALPLSSATSPGISADTTTALHDDDHCAHHETNADATVTTHGAEHDDACAQACHASPADVVITALDLPPQAHTARPLERPRPLVTTIRTPLYRPPIALPA